MVTLLEATVDGSDHAAFFEDLRAVGADTACLIQAVDARYIAGPRHVQTAVEHTRRALETDRQIAEEPAIELLLYLAGTRQIDTAVTIGIEAGTATEAVIIIDGTNEQPAKDQVTALPAVTPTPVSMGEEQTLQSWFGIPDTERETTDASLELLVCERVALLAAEA